MRVPPGSQLVFNQVVQSGSNALNPNGTFLKSDPKFNDWLGKANDLRLFVVVDRATASGTFVAFMEEAGDEELAWTSTYAEAGIPGLGGTVLSPGETIFAGSDIESARPTYPGISVFGRASLGYRRLSVGLGFTTAQFTARVRIWASGHNGYRRFHRLLLMERLEGTGFITTPNESCAWLAGPDILTVGVQTDEVVGSPTLSIFQGQSANGRIWVDGTPGPFSIVSGIVYAGGISTSNSGGNPGLMRFGLQLAGTNPAATVRLWVTGRDVRSG